jgi:hypothetical protein
MLPKDYNEHKDLTGKIVDYAVKVHKQLRPGLSELSTQSVVKYKPTLVR